MPRSKLIIRPYDTGSGTPAPNTVVVDLATFRNWARRGVLLKHLFRYQEVEVRTYAVDVMHRPLIYSLLARLLSRGVCQIIDEAGHIQRISWGFILRQFGGFLYDLYRLPKLLCALYSEIDALSAIQHTGAPAKLNLSARPVYLRTDLVFGLRAGGSVGHIAGVLNHFDAFTGKPILLTTDSIPTVRPDIESHQIRPGARFRNMTEIARLAFNEAAFHQARSCLDGQELAFIYQRYGPNNYTGLKLARAFGVPLVLEYNGSAIWVSRYWDSRLRFERLAEKIELLNLRSADQVVVVSRPLKDELVARGIRADKILVNPNGVDPNRYSPLVDGSSVRQQYDLNRKTVVGFIGTFGPWHGAEVLAEAFGRLLQAYPAYRERVYLLMIGDGVTLPQVKFHLTAYAIHDATILTGAVPQAEGPKYLAACDILVSPHVPNPDGTPFFGSPTKLFEYMAMGKGIVASDLFQIGEILSHNCTAWLVNPGNIDSLMNGIKTLIDDASLRARLGAEARREVIGKYSWHAHTQRIVEHLENLYSLLHLGD